MHRLELTADELQMLAVMLQNATVQGASSARLLVALLDKVTAAASAATPQAQGEA